MKKLKLKIFNYLMKHLFNSVTEDELLRIKGRNIVVGGVVQGNQAITGLRSEARTIQTLPLWDYLVKDMKHLANKKIFTDSRNVEDIIAGKMMLFTIKVMEDKIENIKNLKV